MKQLYIIIFSIFAANASLATNYQTVNPYVAKGVCEDVVTGIKSYSGENQVYSRMQKDCGVTDVTATFKKGRCLVTITSTKGKQKLVFKLSKLNNDPSREIYKKINCGRRRHWKICRGGQWQKDKMWCKWSERPSGYSATQF